MFGGVRNIVGRRRPWGDHVVSRTFGASSWSSLGADHLLSDDQSEIRESVRHFAQKMIAPHADTVDAHCASPKIGGIQFEHRSLYKEIWAAMGGLGLLGPTVSSDYGGLGASYLEHCLMMEQISRASGSIALSYGAHSNLCVNQIHRWGTEEQKRKYLPGLLDGSMIGALAMSEVNAGSDVLSLKTTAVEDGDHFVLNGNKMWCTNGPIADLIVVYAKTDPSKEPKRGVTTFLVDTSTEGFAVGQELDKLGMRGSPTSELVLQDCRIPKENVMGKLNEGAKVLMSGLDAERLVLAAGPVGLMQACWDVALPYVNLREQFGQKIGDFQLVQGILADMYTTLLSSRTLLYSLAKAYSESKATREDCAAVILSNAENASWMASKAIQLLGGNGYVNDYPTGRIFRDAKLYEIGAGTSEIRRMLIGRELCAKFRRDN